MGNDWHCGGEVVNRHSKSFLISNVMILNAGMFWSSKRQFESKMWKQNHIFLKLRSPNNMQIFFSGQF